jgi:ABC-type transporter Mla MlaB component
MKPTEIVIEELNNSTISEFLQQNEEILSGQIPIILQFESIDGSGFQLLVSLKKLYQSTGSAFHISSSKQTLDQIRLLGLEMSMEEMK